MSRLSHYRYMEGQSGYGADWDSLANSEWNTVKATCPPLMPTGSITSGSITVVTSPQTLVRNTQYLLCAMAAEAGIRKEGSQTISYAQLIDNALMAVNTRGSALYKAEYTLAEETAFAVTISDIIRSEEPQFSALVPDIWKAWKETYDAYVQGLAAEAAEKGEVDMVDALEEASSQLTPWYKKPVFYIPAGIGVSVGLFLLIRSMRK